MANYTQAEIDAAVKKYLRTDIRTTRDALGPRDVDAVFAEVMEFISSGLIFDTNAVFYLLYLVKNRVNQDLASAQLAVSDLSQAIEEVGRYTTKVTQTSLLSDAAAALTEADRLLSEKKTIASPQFSRYEKALDQFIDVSLAPNVRQLVGSYPSTYQVVRPPQAAQTAMRSDIDSLRDLHSSLLAEVAQLGVAFDEFLEQNLPVLAVQTSLQKVNADLKSMQAEFEGGSEAEAIEMTRDAYLRITAGRSVINNLHTMRDPAAYRMQGAAATSDRAQAAVGSDMTPGQVETSKSAPYHVIPGANDTISLRLDGATDISIVLTPPEPAVVFGTISDQSAFEISAARKASITSATAGPYTISAAPDNVFKIYVDGVGFTVQLTPGSQEAYEVAAEVMAATRIDGESGIFADVAEATFEAATLGFQHLSAGPGSITIGDGTANTALDLTTGSTDQGTAANNVLRLFVDDETEVLVTLTSGTRGADDIATDISNASPLVEGTTYSLGSAYGVVIISKSYGEQSRIQVIPTTDVHKAAMATLGFYSGQSARSSYVSLEALYSAVNAVPGVQPVRSSTSLAAGLGGVATLVAGAYVLELPESSIPSGLTTSDSLQLGSGENAGNYRIVSFTQGTQDKVTVDRPFPAVSGEAAQNQKWEFRRDHLIIESIATDLTSAVEVVAENTALGLSVGVNLGTTSGIRVMSEGKVQSFTRNNVVAGDLLSLAGVTTPYTISEISEDGYQIEVTPEVSNDLTGQYFYIEGAAAKAYATFIEALQSWQAAVSSSDFATDILELERRLNPLIFNTRPTTTAVNDARRSTEELAQLYTDLQTVFTSYIVSKVSLVDALLDMLLEKGMRRGHDLLLLGQFEDFFSATRDTVSYGGDMMEKMRKVVQNDVPVSRGLDGGQGEAQLTGSFTDVDYMTDFSDGDDEREIAETDDIPEPDVDDQILET